MRSQYDAIGNHYDNWKETPTPAYAGAPTVPVPVGRPFLDNPLSIDLTAGVAQVQFEGAGRTGVTIRSKAMALYEAIRPLLGSHSADPIQQAMEQELGRMLPVWSEERPSCAGWYWYKPPGIEEPRLVYVDNGRIDAKLMADLGPPNNLVDVNRIKGQWAGPLEPPGW